MREEERTVSVSRPRVPVPNARLKRRRKAEELAPSMAQAARTETARGRGMNFRISILVRAVSLCHTANYLLRKWTRTGGRVCEATLVGHEMGPPHRRSRARRRPRRTYLPKRVAFHTFFPFVKGWTNPPPPTDKNVRRCF